MEDRMLRSGKLVSVAILAAYALTTADAQVAKPAATAARAADEVCIDARVGKTFGGDVAGCREYLDACLSDLTDAQRAEWRRSVDSCLDGDAALYRCYTEVPWC
jgi:hypothetical protein